MKFNQHPINALGKGVFFALGAAFLFGISAPAAKILVGSVEPALLAGLLYLGSAAGLGVWLLIGLVRGVRRNEAPLRRKDLGWLSGAILSGGVLGPLLLMMGLQKLSGFAASLLLNMESVFTILLAWFLFRENFDRRIAIGVAFIILGGVSLSWSGGGGEFGWDGFVLLLGACLAWGIDNNLTRQISGGDPIQIAFAKGLVGGLVNLAVAAKSGALSIGFSTAAASAVLGLFGYGISLVFFILALRHMGTARTGAYFATAPFIGSIFSVLLLGDVVTVNLLFAAILMGWGVWLHLSERHGHEHLHEPLAHEHAHSHDSHHQHDHSDSDDVHEPHSHRHDHSPLAHSHHHFPDLHHKHSHAK